MKINRRMIAIIFFSMFLISAAPYTYAVITRVGSIEEDKSWVIGPNNHAKYYVQGTSGRVEFTCTLQGSVTPSSGEPIRAILAPDDNFDNEINGLMTPLSMGMNGPFIWMLTDEKEEVGSIKIFYISGENVTVQCRGQRR